MTYNPINSIGNFIPTSTWIPEDFEQFRIKFIQLYQSIANASNSHQSGIYDQQEQLAAQSFFTNGDPQKKRNPFRTCYVIGTINPGATQTTAHGISSITSFSNIYGTVITASSDFRPLPFVSATAVTNQIEVRVDATNFYIVNGATAPQVSSGLLVLEYFK